MKKVTKTHESVAKKKSTNRRGWYTKEAMEKKLQWSKFLGSNWYPPSSCMVRSRKRSFLLTCGSILIYSIHDLYFILSVLQCPQEIEQCTWEFNLPTYLRLLDMVHAQIKVSTLASLASKLNLSRTNQHSAQQMF